MNKSDFSAPSPQKKSPERAIAKPGAPLVIHVYGDTAIMVGTQMNKMQEKQYADAIHVNSGLA